MIDDITNIGGFAARDLRGIDKWQIRTQADVLFATQFPSLTTVGTPIYSMRWRIMGKACQVQMQFSAGTTIASVAGTDYFLLPIMPYQTLAGANYAVGLAGIGMMTDNNTKIAVGLCHVDLVNGRCYLPTQAASAHVFAVFAEYEVA